MRERLAKLDEKGTFKKIRTVLLLMVLLLVMFLLSNQNGTTSNNMTLGIVNVLKESVFKDYKGDYFKMERKGNDFKQFYSSDGEEWRTIDKPEIVSMKEEVYVGLMLTSHAENKLSSAIFDNVKILPAKTKGVTVWFNEDIGEVLPAGSGTNKEGEFILNAGGQNEWERADEYNYYYTQVTGDFTVTARIKYIEGNGNWDLAGLGIREKLEPGSKFAGLVITPKGFISPYWRAADNSSTYMKWGQTALYDYNIKVRKALHFFGYFILFFALLRTFGLFKIKGMKAIAIAIVSCALIAAFDEFHQIFITGRDAKIQDVFIDTAGAVLGLITVSLIQLIYKKRAKARATME